MPKFVPVSRDHHSTSRWNTASPLALAARHHTAPITIIELPKAVMQFPVCFERQGEAYALVAMHGFAKGNNLFVSKNRGWLGNYIPLVYQTQPFAFWENKDGQLVLCVDDEQVLKDQNSGGEPFFDAEGKTTPTIARIMNLLGLMRQSQAQTQAACAALNEYSLIQPWPIKLKDANGEQTLEGFFRIDEQALSALPDAAFLELRKKGALPLALFQLLSLQHFPLLGKLAELHAADVSKKQKEETPVITNDTISFDALG